MICQSEQRSVWSLHVTQTTMDVLRAGGTRRPRGLVGDDDAVLRTLLTTVLKRHGYRVETACNGEEAVEILSAMTFDAVILDLMMPRVDGFEVLERLEVRFPSLLGRVI